MKVLIAAVAIVVMFVASIAGSYALSLQVNQQSTQRLCNAFSLFIKPVPPPYNTPLKQRAELQYQRLQIFKHNLGCHY